MKELAKVTKGKPLVIGKKPAVDKPQSVDERLAMMQAQLDRMEEMLKKALG